MKSFNKNGRPSLYAADSPAYLIQNPEVPKDLIYGDVYIAVTSYKDTAKVSYAIVGMHYDHLPAYYLTYISAEMAKYENTPAPYSGTDYYYTGLNVGQPSERWGTMVLDNTINTELVLIKGKYFDSFLKEGRLIFENKSPKEIANANVAKATGARKMYLEGVIKGQIIPEILE